MDLLPPVGWADLARQSDITVLRGEMARLGARLDAQLPKFVWDVPIRFGVAGLVLAAGKLA